MAFFKLNIKMINENIERYVDNSKDLSEHIDSVYSNLVNSDAYWKDYNNILFIEKIKRDGYKMKDYISYLDKSCKEVKIFIRSIENTCNKYGYKNIKFIKFDDLKLSDCIKKIDESIDMLNNSIKRCNSLKNDIKLASIVSLINKINKVKKVVAELEKLKSDILEFSDDINDCLIASKIRKRKIEKVDLDISLIKITSNNK